MKKDFNRPMFLYYGIGIIIVFLISFMLMPKMRQDTVQTKEVSYNEFLTLVDEGKVKEAHIADKAIGFTVKGEDKVRYDTSRFPDESLVNRLYENGVEFDREYPSEMNPILQSLLSFGLMVLLMVAVGQIFIRSMTKSMGKGGVGPMSFGKSNAKIYDQSVEGITFDNVAGQDEAKEALREIVDFLYNPKKYSEIGAKLPKGALLVGPPGTGKTLMAKAVAGEASVPFFSISGSEFVEMFVGLGAAKVRDLFEQAKEKAPCIVFIDEIDTIGKKRDGAGFSGNDEREQTLNQLLAEMDGFEGNGGVVILAATNRPESLDPALLRPGRFDRRIPVELPDLMGREAILKVHAKDVKTEPNIDYNAVARATAGASGADLANMINEAALRAVRMGRERMREEDLMESVEVVIAGYERKNMVISPREKQIIAYHEVGHALVAALQKESAPVHKITIIPRTSGALGYTMQVDEEERFLMSKEEAFNKIVTLTGGRAAEELIFNTRTTGASNDIEQATKIARAMITRYGMADEFGFVAMETVTNKYLGGDTTLAVSDRRAFDVDMAVHAIVTAAQEKSHEILTENVDSLHAISNYLLKKETITGQEFMDILQKNSDVNVPLTVEDEKPQSVSGASSDLPAAKNPEETDGETGILPKENEDDEPSDENPA
ncbi:ATP-dependent zinc metalloprotease FtsH [Aedoeadaptatus ivorii]|uniref:ATP-dependent zinc metalloprotease FtsH n=2 Tax=Aedoeadaptatus ivorii TaxID=54006 RepID=A0A3S5BW23_9FIRM|nr:cell division protease FtsH [Peptoniphilus ivorii]VEJ35299.1 ATP-dependent zinc metalloprotease FtsH [Peptoniphilus ivorii]